MRYRKQDANGDYSYGHGLVDFYIDIPEAVGQAVLTRLRLWVAEWFLDTAEGTPYEQSALGTNKMNTIEPALRDRILETTGVTGIETGSFQLLWDAENRHIEVSATIDTEYGQTEISGVL